MSDNPFQDDDSRKTIVARPVPGGRSARPASPSPPPQVAPDSDNPFQGTPHLDVGGRRATVAGPAQGGRATLPPRRADPPTPAAEPAGELVGPVATGQSALVVAATPLLQLLGRLRNTSRPPDPDSLRSRTLQGIRAFEVAARGAGVPQEVVLPARYALCASIDDLVMHTPWGSASQWVQASLTSILHKEVVSGEGFFEQLDGLKREPARNLDLLELMYVCLSLGYQGQYRLRTQGPAQLDHVREDLYQTIVRLRGARDGGLSARWKGVDAPYHPGRAVVPVWVIAAVVAALVGGAWLAAYYWLGGASGEAYTQVSRDALPQRMPVLERPTGPRAPQPCSNPGPACGGPKPDDPVKERVSSGLQDDVKTKRIELSVTPQLVTVTIGNASPLFASGSATVSPEYEPLLRRIGAVLDEQAGKVMVIGYTDTQPLARGSRWASNLQLSIARAKEVAGILRQTIRDGSRIYPDGKGETQPADGQPVEAQRTEQQHTMNRRVEIMLRRVD